MTHLWWYTARAGGLVTWWLLAGSMLLGLVAAARWRPGGAKPAWTVDLHRHIGGLATIFLGVHIVTVMLDGTTDFGPAEVLVPFASAWRPGAVAWGIVALYLLLAVELTSLARRHLPRHIWRAVHLLAYPLFVVSTVHMFAAGTDVSVPMLAWSAAVACGGVFTMAAVRAAPELFAETGD